MFEFDAEKSEANKSKHGIDFIEAQGIWNDEFASVYLSNYAHERRLALIGEYKDKIWVVIYTERGKNVRIISARRARKNEEKIYFSRRA